MRLIVFMLVVLLELPVWGKDMFKQRIYGKEAPTKMYLFTSLTCPHCAQFHREVLPEIQRKYLATRKTQLIVIDMLMNQANLMGAMLVRCAPEEQMRKIEDDLYENQQSWIWSKTQARSFLKDVAIENGMTSEEFEACLTNKELEKAIIDEQEQMGQLYGVKHMPTLLIRKNEKTASWEGADKEFIMEELSDFFK